MDIASSTVIVELAADPVAPATPSPPPLGEPCGGPQILDTADDASASADIRSAWFDADDAFVYVSLRLGSVEQVEAGPDRAYGVRWFYEHQPVGVTAVAGASGVWVFRFHPSFGRTAGSGTLVSGELLTGSDGLVRIAVPRAILGARAGDMFRNTSAYSWSDLPLNSAVALPSGRTLLDRAPDDVPDPATANNLNFGTGGDYVVGDC